MPALYDLMELVLLILSVIFLSLCFRFSCTNSVWHVSEHLTPLEKSVIALGEGLQHIQAEQEYMKMRERVHRNSELPPQNDDPSALASSRMVAVVRAAAISFSVLVAAV